MERADIQKESEDGSGVAPGMPSGGGFGHHVLQLVTGTTFSQLIAILVSPILTRIFLPEVYGISAVFSSLTVFLGMSSCLRFELSISLPERDGDAANLLALSLFNSFVISLVILLLMAFGGGWVLALLNARALKPYLWLVPLQVFLTGCTLSFTYWHIRFRQFRRLALALILQTAVNYGLQLAIGLAGWPTVATRIGSTVCGALVSAFILVRSGWKLDGGRHWHSVRAGGVAAGFSRYRKFLLISTWSAILSNFSLQLPVFFLSKYFAAATVGFFSLANRFLLLPLSVVGDAVSNVFYQRAARARREGGLAELVMSVFRWLTEVSLVPFFALAFFGKELFFVVFSGQWGESGVYSQILAALAFVMFISSPLSTIFSVLEKQERGLKVQVLIFLSRLGALSIGGALKDPRAALGLYSLFGVVVFGYLAGQIFMSVGAEAKQVFLVLWRIGLRSLPYLAALGCLKALTLPPPVAAAAAAGVVALYFFLFYLREKEMFRSLLKNRGEG